MYPDTRRHLLIKSPLLLIAMLFLQQAATAQKQGQELIDSLVGAVPKTQADTARVKLLAVIGQKYGPNDPDVGTKYAQQALALARSIGWKKGVASAYNILGICATYQSDYVKGIGYYNEALRLFGEANDKRGMSKVIGNLGNVYVYQSDYPRALENNFLALKYAEELEDTFSITVNLNNIGSTYEYLHNYDKGLEYNFKALKLLQQRGDSESIALTLGNIGNLYSGKQIHDTALRYQEQALAYHLRLADYQSCTRDFLNIGTIYIDLRNYNKALEAYFKGLEFSDKIEFRIMESDILGCIGEVLTKITIDSGEKGNRLTVAPALAAKYHIPADRPGILNTAIRYLKRSIAAADSLHNLSGLQHSYFYLAKAQKAAGYLKEALDSKDKYIAFKDSVFSLESKIKVANLETKREIDLKDKQIEIDRLEVAKKRNERAFFIAGFVLVLIVVAIIFRNIKLAAAKESSENRLNAFQARMNPHFIFNSLNSIQSLVLNNETISSIKYLSEFSKLMRQILDSSAKSKVLLLTELRMLSSYIELEQLRFERFTYEINVAPGISPEGTEVPAMIIQPFVENAIIHGILPKGGAGILSVSFEQEDHFITCTIDDNGIGRKRSAELNQGRSKEHQSHGVSIAANRLALLGGKRKGSHAAVTYIDKEESGVPTGTRVILQIPVL